MSESASFARRIDALAEIFAFTAAAFARRGVPDALLVDVRARGWRAVARVADLFEQAERGGVAGDDRGVDAVEADRAELAKEIDKTSDPMRKMIKEGMLRLGEGAQAGAFTIGRFLAVKEAPTPREN